MKNKLDPTKIDCSRFVACFPILGLVKRAGSQQTIARSPLPFSRRIGLLTRLIGRIYYTPTSPPFPKKVPT
jgi:hypothetical protein